MPIEPKASLATSGPPEVTELLDPADVQRALKLSSRRVARELIVREMEHVLVRRTPMTTTEWLADWLEYRRRAPRRQVTSTDSPVMQIVRDGRARKSVPAMPAARTRRKSA